MEIGRLGHGITGLIGLGAGAGLLAGGVETIKAADTHRAIYNGGYGGYGGGYGGGGYGGYGHNDTVENTTSGLGIGLTIGGALAFIAGGFGIAKATGHGKVLPTFGKV